MQLPDARVGQPPAVGALVGEMRQRLGAARVEDVAAGDEPPRGLEDVAVDAVLVLLARQVADPHRRGALVAGQRNRRRVGDVVAA